MTFNQPSSYPDPDLVPAISVLVKNDLIEAREEFMALLASLSDEDFNWKNAESTWTIKELLVHVLFWLQQTSRLVEMMLQGKHLPHVPDVVFNWANLWITRIVARRQDRASMIRQYDLAFQKLMQLVDNIPPDDWLTGFYFGAPFHKYRTIEMVMRSQRIHMREHGDEIRHYLEHR